MDDDDDAHASPVEAAAWFRREWPELRLTATLLADATDDAALEDLVASFVATGDALANVNGDDG